MDSKKIWFLMLVGFSIISFTDAHLSIISNTICIVKCGAVTIRCYSKAGLTTIIAFTGKVDSTSLALEVCNREYDNCTSKCKQPKPTVSPMVFGDCGPYKSND